MEQKNFEFKNEVKYDENSSQNCCQFDQMMMCQPIQECPQERICHRYICYEVPHIMPCNTRVINHHVYRHTYTPCYTSCEENVISNVYDRKCCF